MNSDSPKDNKGSQLHEVDIDAIGKKWKILLTMGKICAIAGFLLCLCLLVLGIQRFPVILDVSVWLFLGGFILYVIGRLGSW